MSKELLTVVEMVSNEKALDKNTIFEAMEIALAMATRKKSNVDMDVRVDIDRKTGEYDTYRRWVVVADEELENPDAEVTLTQAKKQDSSLSVGDMIEVPIESIEFGRIAAQTAKNVIVQKVREAERERMVKDFTTRIGEILTGSVKRVTRDFINVDLGDNAEATLPREEVIPREAIRVGDRIKAILKEVRRDQRGPHLILSRTDPAMVKALFKQEVPEVAEEVIDIVAVARDPGVRAKIAVKTNDGRIDPVGACVGMRGGRVQAVSNELNGERVDIILWDENPAQFVINAMSPAEVVSIVMDEDKHTMDIAVQDEQLSQAIGKNGQNVVLASELTGWRLNVMSSSVAQEKQETEQSALAESFMSALEVDEELAHLLVAEGFTSLEEIAYVDPEELLSIDEFDEELVAELQERARNALLSRALAGKQPHADLLALEGMTPALASALAQAGICSAEDLAEQSVDEIEMIPGMTPTLAAELIMAARAPWFAESDEQENA